MAVRPPAPPPPPSPSSSPAPSAAAPSAAAPASAAPVPASRSAAAPGAVRRRWAAASTPVRLQSLLVALLLASLGWGAVGTWTVLRQSSAAGGVVSVSEPLSLDARQMYQSLADADVTAATAFLSGPDESLAARQRYAADISQAAADLSVLRDAAGPAGQPLQASLAAVAAGLPAYTGYIAQAQTEYALGYPLTGGSFMQVASGEMHVTLLPAARAVYTRQNAALTTQSAQASGLPWIAVTAALGLAILAVLYRVQRWLGRRTHRVVNSGLLLASAALAVALLWLVAAFAVARSDLSQAAGQGSVPAELLARASIDAQEIRGDEVLNLISRSGDATFVADSRAARATLGPGPGTLLTGAAGAAPGRAGSRWAQAAGQQATAWYAVSDRGYALDARAQYAAETALVTGSGPGAAEPPFARLESDLSRGIAADQVVFDRSAAGGRDAFGGLAAGIVVAALIMAVASAWGLARRLAEYR
jgi:hypothetical protein